MFIAMGILYPLIAEHEITLRALLIGIPIWLIGGLVWGSTMKIGMNKRKKKNK